MTISRFDLAQPFLKLVQPEFAHRLTIRALTLGLGAVAAQPDDPILAIRRFGLNFANPVGLAAGFDKNAEVLAAVLRLGFGFAEFGTVTPQAQAGNPKPRVFRVPSHRAVINRLGFNNDGMDAAVRRIEALRASGQALAGPIGGNIGKNKNQTDAVADYVVGTARLSPLVDYLTVNVSSPNTPGLRALQSRAALTELLSAVLGARQRPVPVLVKIAPDLTEADVEDVVRAVIDTQTSGIIVSNTTISRPTDLPSGLAAEGGGLSGAPLFEPSTEMLRRVYRIAEDSIPLIGVGGISGPDEAYTKIRAGASLLQLYTALVYEGPGLVTRIKTGLAARLRADGFETLSDAIGVDAR